MLCSFKFRRRPSPDRPLRVYSGNGNDYSVVPPSPVSPEMASSILRAPLVRVGLLAVLLGVASRGVMTQVSSPADRPWSGQAQCVVSTTGTNYQDEQTHTWRLTGAPPVIVGSTRQWPAVWTVQGKGRRAFASTTTRSAPATAVDSWTNDSPDV